MWAPRTALSTFVTSNCRLCRHRHHHHPHHHPQRSNGIFFDYFQLIRYLFFVSLLVCSCVFFFILFSFKRRNELIENNWKICVYTSIWYALKSFKWFHPHTFESTCANTNFTPISVQHSHTIEMYVQQVQHVWRLCSHSVQRMWWVDDGSGDGKKKPAIWFSHNNRIRMFASVEFANSDSFERFM